jgi:hypothetical protein
MMILPDRAAAAASCDQVDNPAVPVQYITCRYTDDRGHLGGPVLGEGWIDFPMYLGSNTTGVAMVYGQWDDLANVNFNGYDLVRLLYQAGSPVSGSMCWPTGHSIRWSDADIAVPSYAFFPGMVNHLNVYLADACGEFRAVDIQLQVTHAVATGPPTMTLSASKNPIIRGESVTISWTTTNATVIYDYQSHQVTTEVPTGSRTYTPQQRTTYWFTAGNGVSPWIPTRSITIDVVDPPTPTMNFTVNGTSGALTVPAHSPLQLVWTTQYVDSCTKSATPARSDWTGAAGLPIGTQSITSLTTTTTFTLSCTAAPTAYRPAGWSDSKSITVTVGTNWLTLNEPQLDCTTNITQPQLTLTWGGTPPTGVTPIRFYVWVDGNNTSTVANAGPTSWTTTFPVVNLTTATYFVTALLSHPGTSVTSSVMSNSITYPVHCSENFGANLRPPEATVSPGNSQRFTASASMNEIPLQLNQRATTSQQICETTQTFESNYVGATFGQLESAGWVATASGSPRLSVRGSGGNPDQQLEFRRLAGAWPGSSGEYVQRLGGIPSPGSTMATPLASGSVSFDVKPLQSDASLGIYLQSQRGNAVMVYLGSSGLLQYRDSALPAGSDQRRSLGVPYQANQWQRLTLEWTPVAVTIAVNGTVVANGLPYSLPAMAGPISALVLMSGAGVGWGASTAGNFLIDNVTYPNSCSLATSNLTYQWSVNPLVGTITPDPTHPELATLTATNNLGSYNDAVSVRTVFAPSGSAPFDETARVQVTIVPGGAGLIQGDVHAGGAVRNLAVDQNSVVSASGDVDVTGSSLKIPNYAPSNQLNWDEAKGAIVDQAKRLRKERVTTDQVFPVAGVSGSRASGFTLSDSVFNLNPKNGLPTDRNDVDRTKPEGTVWWVPGNLTIDRPITVYGRGTLLVEGKVTITADISYGPPIGGTPASLGIIAACTAESAASCPSSSDITIAPSVAKLVGAYFSADGAIRFTADPGATGSPTATVDTQSGQVLHLKFDDPQLPPAYDSGPLTKYNGTCQRVAGFAYGAVTPANCPTPTDTLGGFFGRAAQFDGVDDVVTIPAQYGDQTFQGSSKLTVGTWLKLSDTLTAGNDRTILSKAYTYQPTWELRLIGENHLRFTIGPSFSVEGRSSLIPGQWYWVTATYDNETVKLFVNGQLDGSAGPQLDQLQPVYNDSLVIGKNAFGIQKFFKGLIDDVLIWNKSFADDEVAVYYREQTGNAVSTATPFVANGLFVGRSIELGRVNAQIRYDGRISTDTPPGFGAVPQPGIRETAP